MKRTLSAIALVAALGFAGAASAQVPTGGADAKGNAPLKHAHTVNDGGAKRGYTSFTQKEAMRHIEHAGYTGVTGLEKGKDGVWRGTATKDGSPRQIGMDFKGNVVEAGPAGMPMTGESHTSTNSTMSHDMAASAASTGAAVGSAAAMGTGMRHHRHHGRRHHHGRHHRMHGRGHCAHPGANGVACSGIDRNDNGISDKEDRAMKSGARP